MKRVSIGAQYMHPLVKAAIFKNDIENLDILYNGGKDLNLPDKKGISALMHAANHGYIELCTYLLEHGVDIGFTNTNGEDVFTYTKDEAIIRILNDYSELGEDPFLSIQWEPEPSFIAKEQNENDIHELQIFQNSLSEIEIFTNDAEWDSSWIDLPFLLEQKKEFLVTDKLSNTLTNIYWEKRIHSKELDLLFQENDAFSKESLLIALSCCGVEVSDDPCLVKKETMNDEVEDFHHEIFSIIAEEESQANDSYYMMCSNHAKQKKNQFQDESTLFLQINKAYQEAYELICTSSKALIVLFQLYLYKNPDNLKTEITKSLGLKTYNLEQIPDREFILEDEVDSFNILQDCLSEDEEATFDSSFQPSLSVGRVLFEGGKIKNEKVQKLLKKVELLPVTDSFFQNEVYKILTIINPSVFCLEQICYELSSRDLESLVVNELVIKLQEIQKMRYEIALKNYGLVFFVLKRYPAPNIPREDSIQEGFLGLVRAIEKFDNDAGTKLSTYAVIWIRQTIGRNKDLTFSTIRYPVHFISLYSKYEKLLLTYEELGGDIPSTEEIANLLEITEVAALGLIQNYHDSLSYEEIVEASSIFGTNLPYSDFEEETYRNLDQETTNLGCIFSENFDFNKHILIQDLQCVLKEVLSELKANYKDVIEKRFGLFGYKPMTLEEISKEYKLTRERIRQIEAKSLKLISGKYKYKEIMRSYLECEV